MEVEGGGEKEEERRKGGSEYTYYIVSLFYTKEIARLLSLGKRTDIRTAEHTFTGQSRHAVFLETICSFLSRVIHF